MENNKIIIAGKLRKKGTIEIPCLWNDYLADKAKNRNKIKSKNLAITDIKRDFELNEIGKDKILVPDVFRKGGSHGKK